MLLLIVAACLSISHMVNDLQMGMIAQVDHEKLYCLMDSM